MMAEGGRGSVETRTGWALDPEYGSRWPEYYVTVVIRGIEPCGLIEWTS